MMSYRGVFTPVELNIVHYTQKPVDKTGANISKDFTVYIMWYTTF